MAAPTREDDVTIDEPPGSQIRYVPLHHVYSSTSGGSLPATASKKPKARKLALRELEDPETEEEEEEEESLVERPPLVQFYARRTKRRRLTSNFFDSAVSAEENDELVEVDEEETEEEEIVEKKKKRVGSSVLGGSEGRVSRGFRKNRRVGGGDGGRSRRKKRNSGVKVVSGTDTTKKWQRLSFQDANPKSFTGLQCKVFWPLDADWYSGRVIEYNSENSRHRVEYNDEDKEDLILSNQKIKFLISGEEMHHLNLRLFTAEGSDDGTQKHEEMAVLTASLEDCQEIEPGDIIWAKLSGHGMWPAIVVDESLIGELKSIKKTSGGRSLPVQFFGTHDFERIRTTQIVPFLKGLISFYNLKCKKPHLVQSLEEAKMYLSEQKLPRKMLWLQNGFHADNSENTSGEDKENTDSDEDAVKDVGFQNTLEGVTKSPYIIGDLQIISTGKIVKDSEHFHDEKFVWPVGYTAIRKFTSITDQNACSLYKMEVMRDTESKIRPLFRVTLESGEQFKGHTPSACWNKIFKRIKKIESGASSGDQGELETTYRSGTDMFGFSDPEVLKLIQDLSKSRFPSKFPMCKSASQKYRDLPVGYRPVRIDWKHLDKCNVCHMDEEYENNLFLQCDKCRMMVHARCYGELEPVGGVLWQCNLCRLGAPESPPPCCLCPVTGGAMKPTTDGRWAHLACAIWIPETCLSDVKRMEPIDGLRRVNKDRWKLLCSICGVSYGACIQCTNSSCRVAYHPLCARVAGFCVELEDEDRLHLLSRGIDEENQNQCIRLLSFCKKHSQTSNEPSATDDQFGQVARRCSDYNPPSNPSGCARSEPYNYFGRRGRKEPEALAAASLKRLFVENQPYVVGGHSQHDVLSSALPSKGAVNSQFPLRLQRMRSAQLDAPNNIISMAEKYKYMRETFRRRLAFGKSGIHGFGIFAKHPHRAGDMMIEYTGELVRPPIADRREHLIYNSLVGAGTYMFRIDDERVIDATRAGSIAHLINHSCEPNCYSRVISVNGDEHIIIFAKRDIHRWEELTYDYRFFSIDEQLSCYCGFPRCRGVVNDVEAEQVSKLHAPRSELIDWDEE